MAAQTAHGAGRGHSAQHLGAYLRRLARSAIGLLRDRHGRTLRRLEDRLDICQLRCPVVGRQLTPPRFLFVVGIAAPIAFDIQFEDCRVANEVAYGGDGHAKVMRHVIPAREWLTGI